MNRQNFLNYCVVAAVVSLSNCAAALPGDDYIPPPSEISKYGAESFIENAKKIIELNQSGKEKAKILFDILLAANKAKSEQQKNLAITMIFDEFPQSPEAKLLLNSIGHRSLLGKVIDLFEESARGSEVANCDRIFRACRNLFACAQPMPANDEVLAFLLLSNEHFQDGKIKLPADREAMVSKKVFKVIGKLRNPGPELLELSESHFEQALFSYVFQGKPAEPLRKSGSFALVRAAILADNRQYKQAVELLDGCDRDNQSFKFLFAKGWLRAKAQNVQGALECFGAIAKGDFDAGQKKLAQESTNIAQNQLLTKARALAQFKAGLDSLQAKDAKEFMAQVSYSSKSKEQNKVLALLNADENRLELALFKNENLWWQLLTSKVETKIFTEKSQVINKVEGQPFMPAIHNVPDFKIDFEHINYFSNLLSFVDLRNPNKTPIMESLKNFFQSSSVQSPELWGEMLKWLEGHCYFFEFQTHDGGVNGAYVVRPDFSKGTLTRYGIETTKGKISGGQFGEIRLDRLEYGEKGFGDAVSKHFPKVKTVEGQVSDQVTQYISLIQLFNQ